MIVGVSGLTLSRLLTLEIVFFNFYHHNLLFFCFPFLFPVSSIDLVKWYIHIFFPFFFEKPKVSFLKTLYFYYSELSKLSVPKQTLLSQVGPCMFQREDAFCWCCSPRDTLFLGAELTTSLGTGMTHSLPVQRRQHCRHIASLRTSLSDLLVQVMPPLEVEMGRKKEAACIQAKEAHVPSLGLGLTHNT